ncbi:hypothetical protein EDC02_1230 [Micromonospora sp. Llam0]|nr:hypothetical protein EDC02_1230 [Micromonospora sp. Llam0]
MFRGTATSAKYACPVTIAPLLSSASRAFRSTRSGRRAGATSRVAGLAAGLLFGAALLAGCSSEGASTDCGLDACTVTFSRGVEASASFLGVEARLIGAEGDRVTVEVAGEQVTLTVGEQASEVGGFDVSLERVTDSEVAIRVARQLG